MVSRLPTIPDVDPAPLTESQVTRLFTQLLERGCALKPQGSARNDPLAMLRRLKPHHLIEIQGHRYFLTNVRRDQQFRFFVGYVQLCEKGLPDHKRPLHPRIFYKDSSLVWRVATHYINTETEHWIGKGDIKPVTENGQTHWYSAEETTNLPFEIQNALDIVSRRVSSPRPDRQSLSLILRDAPDHRVRPYADFSGPRQRDMANARLCINKNDPVAWFRDDTDPRTLVFARGFAPDFKNGFVSASSSRSTLYGGVILRFRILSKNRKIHYVFMRAPAQSWIIPPQPTALRLMSYGVHTVDAHVDDKLCIPGFEYHFTDDREDDGLFTQIPRGYAGDQSPIDPERADASPWTHNMPVIKEFHTSLPSLVKRARF